MDYRSIINETRRLTALGSPLLTACTGGSVQKIGAAAYAPLPSSEEVMVVAVIFSISSGAKHPCRLSCLCWNLTVIKWLPER
jgi:hypothetical protein